MTAFLAPSLVALRNEINTRWPHRDRTSDGWIGDTAHSSRVSDHNPDENGMVHAIDVDVDGIDVAACKRAIIGDPRAWYLIHAGKIYSRTYGWEPRTYTGTNPHNAHFHVSIRYDSTSENTTTSWFGDTPRSSGLPTVDLSNVRAALKVGAAGKQPKSLPGGKLMQAALNDRLRLERAARLVEDGILGPRTVAAVKSYQSRLRRLGARPGDLPDGIVTELDLRRLGRGRFRVRA